MHLQAAWRDPFSIVPRLASRLNTILKRFMYPFHDFGDGVSIHYTCDISRGVASRIAIGHRVYLAPHVWLNVEGDAASTEPTIVIGRGCKIGRSSVISAKNCISFGENVLLAPSVLVMDHDHEYRDPSRPIQEQGTTAGGRVFIEENCWLGYGAVVLCQNEDMSIGRNSVIGAHAVVRKTVPPFSVVAGNPARLVKRFDPLSGAWVRPDG